MTKQQELIKASTTYGLIQSVSEILNDRFTSNGHTLSDNGWHTCNVYALEAGFWKAVRDRDFGSVLTYSTMLAGRGINVADLIMNTVDASSERIGKMEAGAITNLDTIRLQRTTIEQHEKTIADLRAKLGGKETPEPYQHLACGVALESERIPELCYSVETVCDNVVETLVIQGDPAAVKDLVQMVRAENTTCDGPSNGVNIVIDSSAQMTSVSKAGDVAKNLFTPTPVEAQSGVDRLQIATGLILQLPANHEGRATWLKNYAVHPKSAVQREIRKQPTAFYSVSHAEEWVRNTYGSTLSPDE